MIRRTLPPRIEMLRTRHLALFAMGALLAPNAEATTVRRLSLSEVVAFSHSAVRGVVLSQRCQKSNGGVVVTTYRVRVDEDFKNPKRKGHVIELSFPGGTLGGVRCVVPGVPVLKDGQEALLFATRPGANGVCLPVGLAQGCYFVSTDPTTGERRASRSFRGVNLVDPKTGRLVPRHALGGEQELNALQAEIRRLARSGR